jgi:site-specific recombinase XerC
MATRPTITDSSIRDFSLALAAEGKKPKTIRTYTDAAAWLQRTQELEDWSEVRKSRVWAHIALILEDHSPAYASNQFRALQQFCKFLEAEEDIRNPMINLKPPAVPQKLVPVIRDDEWSKLIGTCTTKRVNDLRDKAILEFLQVNRCPALRGRGPAGHRHRPGPACCHRDRQGVQGSLGGSRLPMSRPERHSRWPEARILP